MLFSQGFGVKWARATSWGKARIYNIYSQIMWDLLLNVFTQHKAESVYDLWQWMLLCSLFPTDHALYLVDNYYLKPEANILQIPKRHDFVLRYQNSHILNNSPELDYWFTCVLSAVVWCNFLVISQVFVCSQPLLRCICHVLLYCAVTRGTNPWPTVLVFLLSKGWRSIPFKHSQLWIHSTLAGNKNNDSSKKRNSRRPYLLNGW